MFNNPGEQLKRLATAFFWIEVATAVIVGLILCALMSQVDLTLRVIVFLVLIAYGVIIGWLSGILLYAFGDIANDLKQTKSLLELQYGYTQETHNNMNPQYSAPNQYRR